MRSEVIIKSWGTLSKHELYAMIQLREKVFIVEQKCPYLDADGKDPKSHHAIIMNDSICWRALAYCRPGFLMMNGLSGVSYVMNKLDAWAMAGLL